MLKPCVLSFIVVAMYTFPASAQDITLVNFLNDSLSGSLKTNFVTGTFKATQIVNMPTVESPPKKTLQFLIMHRFGELSDGAYQFFGLDNAEIRFGLDYGFSKRLSVGIGRSSFEKTLDANFKFKLIRQQNAGMPMSVSLYELVTYTTFPQQKEKPFLTAQFRTAYTSQLLIARKFSRNLSLQFAPSFFHFNMVPTPKDKNDVFAAVLGGRMKIAKRMSIDAEGSYLPRGQVNSVKAFNSLSCALTMETGGHVFQFVFTNSRAMTAPLYLTKTLGSWQKGNIYFGFNISRSFNWRTKADIDRRR